MIGCCDYYPFGFTTLSIQSYDFFGFSLRQLIEIRCLLVAHKAKPESKEATALDLHKHGQITRIT